MAPSPAPPPIDGPDATSPAGREYDVAAAMRRALAEAAEAAEAAGTPAKPDGGAAVPAPPAPVVPSWRGRIARRLVGPYSRLVQVRFLGYAARWVVALAALPRQRAALKTQGRDITHLSHMVHDLTARLGALQAASTVQQSAIAAGQGEIATLRGEIAALRDGNAALQRELATLRGVQSDAQAAFEAYRDRNAIPDDVYLAFEDWFRGPGALIRQRLGVYIALLREPGVPAGLPVLDIGCGRGEWLSLLAENGIPARGVDTNTEMIAQCRAQGLAVEHTDALAALAALPSGSLAGLTGFHIIEHIPLRALQTLLAEAHRVLAPGGVLILETPNPENLVVGSCNFYIDPTHARPVHPLTVQFLARVFGFQESEILRLNQYRLEEVLDRLPDGDRLAGTVNPVVDQVQAHLLAAPDYALVARRTAPAGRPQ